MRLLSICTSTALHMSPFPPAFVPGETFPRFYRIGTPGKPWGDAEKAEWKAQVQLQRSYSADVLSVLQSKEIQKEFKIESYGSLSCDTSRYPLYIAKTKDWDATNPCVLVTGGVHGYETSGVMGALQFLTERAKSYERHFNIMVAPCVSPWAYEHIQRWDMNIKDPNRSFKAGSETEESQPLMDYMKEYTIFAHFDLHETTNSDAEEFMPAKHAEAGLNYEGETIPDGFYLVGDDRQPKLDYQTAIIESVKKITHIAPPDEQGCIIDVKIAHEGIIQVDAKSLGLCAGMTNAAFTTTTEVYPDSPRVTDELCNQAQVAAITGGLEYLIQHEL